MVTVAGLVFRNNGGSGNNPPDVLQEDESRFAIGCDPKQLEEKPAPSALAKASPGPCDAEVLAGKAASDRINSSAEESAVQGSDVGPDRGGVEVAVCHPRLEHLLGGRVGLAPEDGPGPDSDGSEG